VSQVETLQARIRDLEDELSYAKAELSLSAERDRVARLQMTFAISPAQGRVLLRLYKARGSVVSHEAVIHCASPDPEEVGSNLGKAQVCYLRRKFGRELITSVWGVGYALTPEGLEKVQAILDPQPAEAAA
jgi:DNA-binding response OmpR family regulator